MSRGRILFVVLAHLHGDHGGQPTHCPDGVLSPTLDAPMYFFFGYLSFMDAFYSTSVTPNTIIDLLYEKKPFHFKLA